MTVSGIYVVEHKTTSLDIVPGQPYWKRLVLDGQGSKYAAGARALGYEPIGVLYDVVKKPTQRPLQATPAEKREYTKPKDKACPECKKSVGTHMIEIDRLDREAPGDRLGEPVLVRCSGGRVVTDPGGRLYANMREHDETPEEFRRRLRADIEQEPGKYFQRGAVVRLDGEEKDAARDTWALAKQMREAQRANRWPRNPDACDSYGVACPYFSVCSGEASIDDPNRYRTVERTQEEVSAGGADHKVRLPLVSPSSMRTFRSCQRRYFYAYERRRRPLHEQEGRRLGEMLRAALDVWWRTGDLASALAAIDNESDPFERVKAEELIRGYHARWANEAMEILSVERQFVAPLVNPETGLESKTWQQVGKIDAIVRVGAIAKAAA